MESFAARGTAPNFTVVAPKRGVRGPFLNTPVLVAHNGANARCTKALQKMCTAASIVFLTLKSNPSSSQLYSQFIDTLERPSFHHHARKDKDNQPNMMMRMLATPEVTKAVATPNNVLEIMYDGDDSESEAIKQFLKSKLFGKDYEPLIRRRRRLKKKIRHRGGHSSRKMQAKLKKVELELTNIVTPGRLALLRQCRNLWRVDEAFPILLGSISNIACGTPILLIDAAGSVLKVQIVSLYKRDDKYMVVRANLVLKGEDKLLEIVGKEGRLRLKDCENLPAKDLKELLQEYRRQQMMQKMLLGKASTDEFFFEMMADSRQSDSELALHKKALEDPLGVLRARMGKSGMDVDAIMQEMVEKSMKSVDARTRRMFKKMMAPREAGTVLEMVFAGQCELMLDYAKSFGSPMLFGAGVPNRYMRNLFLGKCAVDSLGCRELETVIITKDEIQAANLAAVLEGKPNVVKQAFILKDGNFVVNGDISPQIE